MAKARAATQAAARKDDERLLRPNRFRKRQGPVEHGPVMADDKGEIAQPFRVIDLLTVLERNNTITPAMHKAGDQFREQFRLAGSDPLRAADIERVRVAGNFVDSGGGNAGAREQVWRAVKALGGFGSPLGACAWHVLGCEESLKAWAQREGWGGRPIHHRSATGLLVGALGVLQAHYGT